MRLAVVLIFLGKDSTRTRGVADEEADLGLQFVEEVDSVEMLQVGAEVEGVEVLS
jgi:hypothetical protein